MSFRLLRGSDTYETDDHDHKNGPGRKLEKRYKECGSKILLDIFLKQGGHKCH
jgi:hypothetical protein